MILKIVKFLSIAFAIAVVIVFIGYSAVGTRTNVNKIKAIAPIEMQKRGWKILRYEGFQYGSWARNGGIVWYHVCNIDNPNIQYRVNISMWDGELQYYYGSPEVLNRIEYKN